MTIEKSTDPRDRIVAALDVGGLFDAMAYAKEMRPYFNNAKVGMELYAEAGDRAIKELKDMGYRIFLDLKLMDIPTTVERAARAHARCGVDWFNFHAAGGTDMMKAAIAGLAEGASDAGLPKPIALGVTVLTSDPDTSAFDSRLEATLGAGADGVVCSAFEIKTVRAFDANLGTMVPGIRLPGASTNDQARVGTPDGAISDGADWLVIGRTVSAESPGAPRAAAARRVLDSVAEAL